MTTWGQPIALAACATSSSSLSTSSQPDAAHSDMPALASSSAAASNSRWFDPCGGVRRPAHSGHRLAWAHDLQRRKLDVQFPKL